MEGRPQQPPLGTLIFSCNGRGINLYGEPNYDSATLASFVPVPASGMFCNGVRAGHATSVLACRVPICPSVSPIHSFRDGSAWS